MAFLATCVIILRVQRCTAEEPLLPDSPSSSARGSQLDSSEDLRKDSEGGIPGRLRGSLFSDITYGLINAIVGAPTMISFAAIIFSVCSLPNSNTGTLFSCHS